MLTLPTLTDRIADQMNAERAENIRMLNRRIEVTDRYIERLRRQKDDLIAERAGLIAQAELDAVRKLAEFPICDLQFAIDDEIENRKSPIENPDEDPERWDGLS